MSASMSPAPTARKRSGLKVVLIVIAVLSLLGILACGGILAVVYFGFNSALDTQLKPKLAGRPEIETEIGEVESITFNFFDSITASREENGDEVLSCDITGGKGVGRLIVRPSTSGGGDFTPCKLITSDGRTILLDDEDDSAPEFDMGDIDLGTPEIDLGEPVEQT
jgi:hypothetical protein